MRAYNKKNGIIPTLPKTASAQARASAKAADAKAVAVESARAHLPTEISALLEPDTLTQKWLQYEAARASIRRSGDQRIPPPAQVASLIFHEIEASNNFVEFLNAQKADTESGGRVWSSDLATAALRRITELAHIVPQFENISGVAEIVSLGSFAEECRGKISLFAWFTSLGPRLVASMVALFEKDGLAGLEKEYPQFAPLVHHVYEFYELQTKQVYRNGWEKGAAPFAKARKNKNIVQSAEPEPAAKPKRHEIFDQVEQMEVC